MDLIGKTIGNYQIFEEVGRGGMGTVFCAQQPSLNRAVALKVLAPSLGQDAEFFKRFKNEAMATAALDHPNIIHVYDAGEEQGVHFIAMEYISGGNLAARMRKLATPMSPVEAASIAAQIAIGLDYAHRHNIIHRDVKPSNILLDSEGRAILTDLGIAHALEGTRLTHTGMTMGTPEYMSPEQAQGKPLDGRADIYSLGVVLFEMLTGRIPFQGDTPLVILYKQIHELPPDAGKLNANIPKKLLALLSRALAKDPAKRFATGQEFANALLKNVPGASLHLTAPGETILKVSHTPKEIALTALTTTRTIALGTLRTVGALALRLMLRVLEALVAVALVLAVLVAALALVLSLLAAQYAQNTLKSSQWEFSLLDPSTPYIVTTASFASNSAPYIEQRSFGTLSDTRLTFASPDQVILSANALGNSVVLDGTIAARNGAPHLEIRHINGAPLPVVDNIISNGINQGIQESWSNAPIRLSRIIVVDNTTLTIESVNK